MSECRAIGIIISPEHRGLWEAIAKRDGTSCGSVFTFDLVKEACGGHIQRVGILPELNKVFGETMELWVNEEALIFHLPKNPLASAISGRELHGSAVLLPATFLDDVPLSVTPWRNIYQSKYGLYPQSRLAGAYQNEKDKENLPPYARNLNLAEFQLVCLNCRWKGNPEEADIDARDLHRCPKCGGHVGSSSQ